MSRLNTQCELQPLSSIISGLCESLYTASSSQHQADRSWDPERPFYCDLLRIIFILEETIKISQCFGLIV